MDYGSVVYEIKNKDLVKLKSSHTNKSLVYFAINVAISLTTILLGFVTSGYMEYVENYMFVYTYLIAMPVIVMMKLYFIVRENEKHGLDYLTTTVYEKGLVIHQGKPFQIHFDNIVYIHKKRIRGKGVNILIETKNMPKKTYTIGSRSRCVFAFTKPKDLYPWLCRSFENYRMLKLAQ